jgi:serpin B
MRSVVLLSLCLAWGCSGTRTGNPGFRDPPAGVEVASSKLTRDQKPTLTPQDALTFGEDNRAFTLALYHELAKEPGNLMFSPYSISTALAMTYAGAKGKTESELAGALHFTLPQAQLHAAFNATDRELAKRKDELSQRNGAGTKGDGFELNMVNQAWGQRDYQFLDSYLDVLAVNYGAGLFLADFITRAEQTRTLINDWVARETHSRITDLLPPDSLTERTQLVWTNAIYFKASWLNEFKAGATKPGTFMAEAGARDVQMMHDVWELQYAEVSGYQAVLLPYISPEVGMLLVLPPVGSFADAANELDEAVTAALLAHLNTAIVTLSLPKWTFNSERSLKQPLQALGIHDAFEQGVADLSGMDGQPGALYLGGVYHKTFIAVDEQGTEAAAATAVVGSTIVSLITTQVTLTFDRPFMFLVYDRPTGQILFFGHLTDPG